LLPSPFLIGVGVLGAQRIGTGKGSEESKKKKKSTPSHWKYPPGPDALSATRVSASK
jgi:hypothetical protein